jgi:tetratricopeptide (TPR) repeat protein
LLAADAVEENCVIDSGGVLAWMIKRSLPDGVGIVMQQGARSKVCGSGSVSRCTQRLPAKRAGRGNAPAGTISPAGRGLISWLTAIASLVLALLSGCGVATQTAPLQPSPVSASPTRQPATAISQHTPASPASATTTAEAFFAHGVEQYERSEWDEAIDSFTRALALRPEWAEAYAGRGLAYYRKGERAPAIADYDHALALQPTAARLYNNRGLIYYQNGELKQAIADFTQAIDLQSNFAEAYYNRGRASFDSGDSGHAITDYTQALDLKPEWSAAYLGRGVAYAVSGETERAIADYTETLRLAPDNATAHCNRGFAHQKLDRREDALADLRRCQDLSDDPALIQQAAQQLQQLERRP